MNTLINAIRGFCMALADSVPGVSGGTIAFILGFYDKFINSLDAMVSGTKKERIEALKFLAKLLIGWVIGMCLASLVLSSMFKKHIYQVSSLFMGFIVFAIPLIIRDEKKEIKGKYKYLIFLVIGIAVVAAITMILMGINVWITSQIVTIYTGTTRYDRLEFSIENIIQIIRAQKNIWIEGKGILPHGVMALTLGISIVIIGISARKSRINWGKIVYCFFIYCAVVFVTFIPQMLEMWLTPRSLAPLFCVFSIGAYFTVFWSPKEGKCNHQVLAIALMGIFIFANFYYIQKVAISMFQTNMLEKDHAKQIEYEIRKYEQTTGTKIKYICFYQDNIPQYKYGDILLKPGEDMLYNVYLVDWGNIYALNFYTNLNLEKKPPEEQYSQYFAEYNWDCISLQEQLLFEGNTSHYCVY